MKTADFDYILPPEAIAQTPAEPRDHSRLMVLSRQGGWLEHRRFLDIVDYLEPGDVLVGNDSRVIPARLLGHKVAGGGEVSFLLLRRLSPGVWEALAKPGRRLKPGTKVEIRAEPSFSAQVISKAETGIITIHLSDEAALEELGMVPLPPYIHAPLPDPERYQTVYARVRGSVAAPTAGLHFTSELIQRIREKGVEFIFVTLHVGLDTFRPVRVADPQDHALHREYCELDPEVAERLAQAKRERRRIICIGTSAVRAVEEAARSGEVKPFKGWAALYILPGYRFHIVDALVTNFHLPRSTLLMLVSAFAGRELTLYAYQEAMRLGYRFYSFGDAMLIL
jgi:S-adenosylmethionine:tRNA ribosyltransferase-isomerase